MQRTDFDFDVISGPSNPPLVLPATPRPTAAAPRPAEDRETKPAEPPAHG
jgi:hypothetical protein